MAIVGRLATSFALAVLTMSQPAQADDAKNDSVTVLPWSQASLVLTDGDKSAAVEYTQLFEALPVMFYAKVSAPLDSDTRVAAFTSENKLAKGFSATFQVGYDERATVLEDLEKKLQAALEAREFLVSGRVAQELPVKELEAFARRHPEYTFASLGTSELKRTYLCDGVAVCNDVAVARAVCTTLNEPCQSSLDNKVIGDATKAAVRAWATANCESLAAGATDGVRDRCLVAKFYVADMQVQGATLVVARFIESKRNRDALWDALEFVNPGRKEEIYGKRTDPETPARLEERNAAIVLNLPEFLKAIEQLELTRRDLYLTGMLRRPGKGSYAVSVSGDVSYDVLSIHQADLAAEASKEAKYDVSLAANIVYYAATSGLAFSTRMGIGRTRDPQGKKTELCTMRPSTEMTINGKTCDANALFRAGDAPDAETTGSVRAAITYQYGLARSEDEIVPGIELRGGWERTGSDDSVTGRLTLFGTPVKGSAAARVGIALDVGYRVNIGDADSRWDVTPLVFVGATLGGT